VICHQLSNRTARRERHHLPLQVPSTATFDVSVEVDEESIQRIVAVRGAVIDLWVTGLAAGAHTLGLRDHRANTVLYDVAITVSLNEPVSGPPCCAWELPENVVDTRRLIRPSNVTLVLACCEAKQGVELNLQIVAASSSGSGLLRPYASIDTSYRHGRHSYELFLDTPPGTRGEFVVVADGPAGGVHANFFVDETFKFRSIAPTFGPIHIMHIGAHMEHFDSRHPLCSATLGPCDVTTFEPQEEQWAQATFGTAVRRRMALNVAVGAPASGEDGRVLHLTDFAQCTSLYPPNFDELLRFARDPSGQVVKDMVPIFPRSIDDMAASAELTPPVDFLVVDTQGAEHEILRTGASVVVDVLVAIVEVQFRKLYEGAPLFSDVDVLMRRLGFEFYRTIAMSLDKFASPYPTTLKGAMPREADALFLPNASRIAALPTERLLKLAMIMHECKYFLRCVPNDP
jgi:hypothetical protein